MGPALRDETSGFVRRKWESAYFFDDHCDSALEAFPNLARGFFIPVEASPDEMVPSWRFADQCSPTDLECAARESQAAAVHPPPRGTPTG